MSRRNEKYNEEKPGISEGQKTLRYAYKFLKFDEMEHQNRFVNSKCDRPYFM